MEQKPRFLIYSSKEMVVLALLGVLIAVFAFTYGVHLGKRLPAKPDSVATQGPDTPLADPAPDAAPARQEVDAQSHETAAAADGSMSQALRDEVTRTGVRAETPRAARLPKTTRAEKLAKNLKGESALTPGAKFAIQLGSFPALEEAKAFQKEIGEKGVPSAIRGTQVQGKRFFRVLTGGFSTQPEAEDAGKTYVIRSVVDTFVVVPNPDRK